MGRGRATSQVSTKVHQARSSAEDILYGTLPKPRTDQPELLERERNTELTVADLLALDQIYFEDNGWSGAANWAVAKPELPSHWKPVNQYGEVDTSKRVALAGWRLDFSRFFKRLADPDWSWDSLLEVTMVPTNKEQVSGQKQIEVKFINAGTPFVSYYNRAHIQAVEEQIEAQCQWLYCPDSGALMYCPEYVDPRTVYGLVWPNSDQAVWA